MKIAVIDSGLSSEKIKKRCSLDGVCIQNINGEFIANDNYEDDCGHGTSMCDVITSHISNIDIFTVKVTSDGDSYVDVDMLIAGLNYLYDNENVDIVNISISVIASESMAELYDVCRKLYEKGTTIIAAFDNFGGVSYPAAYDFVIGVTSSDYITNNNEFIVVNNKMVNVCAKGRPQRVIGKCDNVEIRLGNSIACAHFTGILATKCINDGMPAAQALKELGIVLMQQLDDGYDNTAITFVTKMQKVVCFPYNKEIHSVVRYSELTAFTVVDVYDTRRSGKVGRKISSPDNNAEYIIKNIEKIDFDSFDTIIIGHTAELNYFDRSIDVKKIICECLRKKKRVFSLDNYDDKLTDEYRLNGSFYSPSLTTKHEDFAPFGKLHYISKPILGVFGTRSKQGKWTLQLELRKRFLNDEYNVGQLGTEPTALLFGMDKCYHFGYGSQRLSNEYERVMHINYLLHQIEMKDADIIISGSQSQTITTNIRNISGYAIDQYIFLEALQPDLVVLSISIEDDTNYIISTIRFLEAAVECKVIALVLFPKRTAIINTANEHITDYERHRLYNEIAKKLGYDMPVYMLDSNHDIDDLYQKIVDFFGE